MDKRLNNILQETVEDVSTPKKILDELKRLEKKGKSIEKGSILEGKIKTIIGHTDTNPTAVLVSIKEKEKKGKIEFIDRKIDQITDNLLERSGGNKALREKLQKEIKDIVTQNKFRSDSEETSDLIRVISGDETMTTTQIEVVVREAKIALDRWQERNIDAVREYRSEDLKKELIEKIKSENPKITDEQLKSANELVDCVNKVYNSEGGIENQKDFALENNKEASIGQLKNAWTDVEGVTGVLKQTPEEFEKLQANYENAMKGLDGVSIPKGFDKVDSFDRIMGSLKEPNIRHVFDMARSRFGWIDRISNGRFGQFTTKIFDRISGGSFGNIANNFFNHSIVNIANGFASQIGNQAVRSFVQNSMGAMLKNGFTGGIQSTLNNLLKKGVEKGLQAGMKAAAKLGLKVAGQALSAAAGAATMGLSKAAELAIKAAKFLGKLAGRLFESMGIELTKSDFLNLIILIVLIVIGLLFMMGTGTANMASSLVPQTEKSETSVTNYDEDMTEVIHCLSSVNNPNAKPMIPYNQDWSNYNEINYNQTLLDRINAAGGKKTRAGVVAAAKFIAVEFPFCIDYSPAEYTDYGIRPQWGKKISEGKYVGMDCSSFLQWTFAQVDLPISDAGNMVDKQGNNIAKEVDFNQSNCEEIKTKAKPGDYVKQTDHYHVGLVIGKSDTQLRVAQSGGYNTYALNVILVDICTGKSRLNSFNKIYLGDNYYEYYKNK